VEHVLIVKVESDLKNIFEAIGKCLVRKPQHLLYILLTIGKMREEIADT